MFTGIIEEIGSIKSISQSGNTLELSIKAKLIIEDIKVGESIAVNGVCLTVTKFGSNYFCAEVMPVTFYATNLAKLRSNSPINLERAMPANGRLGGHVVSGHVDGVAKIISIKANENAIVYTLEIPPELSIFCISKGSIALDGTSLTLNIVIDNKISVWLIPHTRKHSVLGLKAIGEWVNVECDILAKQQAKIAAVKLDEGNSQRRQPQKSKIDEEYLAKHGFI